MILASNSPRRKEILENFGFSLKTVSKNIDEISNKEKITEKIMDIARQKTEAVAVIYPDENVVGADTVVVVEGKILGKPKDEKEAFNMLKSLSGRSHEVITAYSPDENVVGADTVVVVEGKILGKPKDEKEAFNMLKSLSGRSHEVITAYSFINLKNNIMINDVEVTKVFFKKLSDEEINWYINTKEPMDKAGAYGIQGKGAFFVEKIEGDFFSVMGFPLGKFLRRLTEIGIDLNNLENL